MIRSKLIVLTSILIGAISGIELYAQEGAWESKHLKKDLRSQPVNRMVVMGESNAYGMSAIDPRNEWVQTVANSIRNFQSEPLRVFNNAIPSNVISPDAPGYKSDTNSYGTSPSAKERFEQDMVSYKPDMVVYAYGLNDSRCGHSLESFIKSYEYIVKKTREELPNALIVLVGPYWNPQYDSLAWVNRQPQRKGDFWLPGDGIVEGYNKAISTLADKYNALFVDVYNVLRGSPWLVTADDCHFNDMGQSVIGQKVFIELATHCSFLSNKSRKAEKELKSSIRTTGGTQALPHVINSWRSVEKWKQ